MTLVDRDAPTLYQLLGVSRHASARELRHAYVARARRLHPDTGRGGDERAMQALNEAWNVLRDPRRRQAYDRALDERQGRAHRPSPSTASSNGAVYEQEAPPAYRLPEDPPRPPRLGDLVLLLPAAFLVMALALVAMGTMTFNAGALGIGFALLVVSGASFALAPFLSLARQRRSLARQRRSGTRRRRRR